MDRRRLECAHIRFAILKVARWYPDCFTIENIMFSYNFTRVCTIVSENISSKIFRYNTQCIQSQIFGFCVFRIGHWCLKNGCGTVLIIDGNMKNHRAVCAASEAGHIQYAGLDGSVKTGCTNTPNQKNRFCSTHIPRTLLSSSAKHHKVIERPHALITATRLHMAIIMISFTLFYTYRFYGLAWMIVM